MAAPPRILFVTAFDEHALEAFDLAAVDYLLKPVEPARLEPRAGGRVGSGRRGSRGRAHGPG